LPLRLWRCSLLGGASFAQYRFVSQGQICAIPRTRRIYKTLFVIVSVLVVIAVVYPYFAKLFY
jgi:hypothetical protein